MQGSWSLRTMRGRNAIPIQAPAPTFQFLLDSFPGAVTLLSTTKESSSYSGACLRVRRVSDSVEQDIGFVGKSGDATSFTSFIGASTGRLVKWYDQSGNGNDVVQATTARQPQVLVDTDGKLSIKTTATTQGMEVPDAASLKVTKPHLFMVRARPFLDAHERSILIGYTPSGVFEDVARWGISFDYDNGSDGQVYTQLNAATVPQHFGQAVIAGDGSSFFINDFRADTLDLRSSSGFQITTPAASANVTYSGTLKLMIGNNQAYNAGCTNEKWRCIVLYDDAIVGANRNSISSYLAGAAAHDLTALPFTYTDADGFTWVAQVEIGYHFDTVDSNNMHWQREHGGYLYSFQEATNVNNGKELVRAQVKPGDLDMIVTAAERAERFATIGAGQAAWARGDRMSEFYQMKVAAGNTIDSSWLFSNQHHTGASAEPNNICFEFQVTANSVQFESGRNSSQTQRGSAQAVTRGVWYAVVIHAFWSAAGNTDTLEIWFGPNGGALTKVVDISGQIFYTLQSSAIWKQGWYAGDLNDTIAIQIANHVAVLTQDAYSAFVTTQPALPAHA
jgi:hypothetical protein